MQKMATNYLCIIPASPRLVALQLPDTCEGVIEYLATLAYHDTIFFSTG
jgi:hypothetical protein